MQALKYSVIIRGNFECKHNPHGKHGLQCRNYHPCMQNEIKETSAEKLSKNNELDMNLLCLTNEMKLR